MDQLGRRTLLAAGLTAGLGVAVAGCTPDADDSAAGDSFDPKNWDDVRALFPLDRKLVQTAAFVLAAHPKPVRDAIERHRRGLDEDTAAYLHDHGNAEEQLRVVAAEFLGGTTDQVAFTDSTTMGLGLLYSGMRLRADQDVLTSVHDFSAHHRALDLMGQRTGAQVRRISLYEDPTAARGDDIVARLRAAVRPNTRILALTWVHSGTGVRLPIQEIGRLLDEVNAGRAAGDKVLLCVDGVHGFGVVDVPVVELGCDFFATGTHKWLFGPRGTGLLWGRAWDAVAPVIPSFSGSDAPGAQGTPGGYHTFEHRWALREAFDLHTKIGGGRIAARVAVQAAQLKEGLSEIRSLRVITPEDPRDTAGIVCCEIYGMDAPTAVAALRKSGVVASVTPYEEQYLRFGPSIVTTPADMDRVVAAARELKP